MGMAGNPKIVLVMRHAEKSADPYDPDLTEAGKARAKALADYIPKEFGVPDFIFAAAISKHSARPYETVKPLSKKTGVPIDATIADQEYGVLASELLSHAHFAGKSIVVCWHHGNIPSLMNALGAAGGAYPDPWDPAVFNLILKVEFPVGGLSIAKVFEPF
jgi:phosphohistidine phosphatase SixA